MKTYFAGANYRAALEALKGKNVLESFADIRPLVKEYRASWSGAMLDSGAFSAYNSGKNIDLESYIDFCLEHIEFYDQIVVLDDIAGDVDKTKRNLRRMWEAGIEAMPVYHQGEPLSVLEEYCADFTFVGLGFQRPIRDERSWLDDCFDVVPAETKMHGFAMTNYTADYPFYSVDSNTWTWELQALRNAEGRVGRILQCLTWGELLDIVIKNNERLPRIQRWEGRRGPVAACSNQKTIFDLPA